MGLRLFRLGGCPLLNLYELISKHGSRLASSINRSYLQKLKESYPESHISKVKKLRLVQTSQEPKYVSRPLKTRGRITIIPSSWIRNVKYNSISNELFLNMRGKWYGPWYIPPNIYLQFITGKAVPTTTDKRRPARWGKGIGPSLGAAYHKYIKISGSIPLDFSIEQQLIRKQQLLAKI